MPFGVGGFVQHKIILPYCSIESSYRITVQNHLAVLQRSGIVPPGQPAAGGNPVSKTFYSFIIQLQAAFIIKQQEAIWILYIA